MTSSNDFKTGMTIQSDGHLWMVMEFQHVKPGKGPAFVRSKLRNLRSGAVIDKTWRAGEKVAPAHIEKNKMSYLYSMGESYVFMNNETYEQVEIRKENIEYQLNFLVENMEVKFQNFKAFYQKTKGDKTLESYKTIDLQFGNQVVATKTEEDGK